MPVLERSARYVTLGMKDAVEFDAEMWPVGEPVRAVAPHVIEELSGPSQDEPVPHASMHALETARAALHSMHADLEAAHAALALAHQERDEMRARVAETEDGHLDAMRVELDVTRFDLDAAHTELQDAYAALELVHQEADQLRAHTCANEGAGSKGTSSETDAMRAELALTRTELEAARATLAHEDVQAAPLAPCVPTPLVAGKARHKKSGYYEPILRASTHALETMRIEFETTRGELKDSCTELAETRATLSKTRTALALAHEEVDELRARIVAVEGRNAGMESKDDVLAQTVADKHARAAGGPSPVDTGTTKLSGDAQPSIEGDAGGLADPGGVTVITPGYDATPFENADDSDATATQNPCNDEHPVDVLAPTPEQARPSLKETPTKLVTTPTELGKAQAELETAQVELEQARTALAKAHGAQGSGPTGVLAAVLMARVKDAETECIGKVAAAELRAAYAADNLLGQKPADVGNGAWSNGTGRPVDGASEVDKVDGPLFAHREPSAPAGDTAVHG
jgi:hypothetical protein